jgi:hypothetical protein
MRSPRGLKVIPVKKTIAAMVLSIMLGFDAQAQCVFEGAVFEGDFRSDAPFLEGSYRVEILAGQVATITVTVDDPCNEERTDEGTAIGDSNVSIYGQNATFEAECNAEGSLVGALSLQGFCSLEYGPGGSQPTSSPISVTAPPVQGTNPDPTPVGPTPTPGPGGSGSEQVDVRSSLGASKPEAQLVGIEVEINPPVLEISAAATNTKSTGGKNEPDVTITGRLLFSNDNLPAGFDLNAESWKFVPQEIGDGTKYKDWKSAMLGVAHLDFIEWEIPGKEDWEGRGWGENDWEKFEKIAVNGLFIIDKDIPAKNIRSKEIPIRASYTDDDGVEYSQIVNLRIAKKNKNRPVATSSGPSARVVTYSRILE